MRICLEAEIKRSTWGLQEKASGRELELELELELDPVAPECGANIFFMKVEKKLKQSNAM